MMKIQGQCLLLALALTSVQISYTESRLNEKRRDKTERRHHAASHLKENICEITDRESKVHCYCENTEMKKATRADCWVFNGGIIESDPLWNTFNSQPQLEKLSFNVRSDGALTFIPMHIIHRLKRLQKLSIHYATLPKIGKYAFANMSHVKEISLMNDKITELDFSAFANLAALVNLTLKENKISELQRDVFVNLPSLRYLDLSFNNINVVHDGSFEHLTVLNDLVVESNSISILTRDSFRGLSNLTRLDIRSNKLTMIGDLTFAELWNLNDLLLDNNELRYLSDRAFDGLSQLQKLSVTGNKMKLINERLLEGVRGLELLDLRNNELEYFTYETIKPIIDNLKVKSSVLFLSGNYLRCDCRLIWIHSLKNETKSESLRMALDDVTCIPRISSNKIESNSKSAAFSPSNEYGNDNSNVAFKRENIKDDLKENNAVETFEQNDESDEDGYEDNSTAYQNEPTAEPMVVNQLQVTQLSAENLPCEIIRNGEDSLMLSSKDESYWKSSGSRRSVKLTSLVVLSNLILYLMNNDMS